MFDFSLQIFANSELTFLLSQFQLGDGDFKRTRSWRKKFKKDRGRERRDHPVLTRRGSTESDISQQSGSSGSENLNSPAHRNKKSPLAGMFQF